MKPMQKFVVAAFSSLLLFSSCKNDPKTLSSNSDAEKKTTGVSIPAEPELSTEGAAVYVVNEGTVTWQARKNATGATHYGTINTSGGELLVKEGRVLSGNIKIDMNSLSVSDLKDPKEKSDLEGHLKSPDFFDVKKYPSAEYTIEETLPTQIPNFNRAIVGSLSLKGKSNAVNLPVNMTIDKSNLTASTGTVGINRTQWDINFGSGIIGTVKDKLIDDVVMIGVTLKATAK